MRPTNALVSVEGGTDDRFLSSVKRPCLAAVLTSQSATRGSRADEGVRPTKN